MPSAVCPFCRTRLTLDDGILPDHDTHGDPDYNDDDTDECEGANLPLWAAEADAGSRDV
jgi:hypothetical protein